MEEIHEFCFKEFAAVCLFWNFFVPINEREKQGRWGGGSCKKGELHMEEKRPKARREYKDTVFRMLFSDEKNLLSLYNAVTGRSYEDAKELEIVTLDNAVYMGMKNDLSFLLDTHISCMSISRRRIRTCRSETCSTYRWSIRSM